MQEGWSSRRVLEWTRGLRIGMSLCDLRVVGDRVGLALPAEAGNCMTVEVAMKAAAGSCAGPGMVALGPSAIIELEA